MPFHTEVIKNDGHRWVAMTGAYERELREILSGSPKGVEGAIKSCTPEEQERMRLVIFHPFMVVRAAGSGMEGSGDLVALRGDCSFPIEVKTTKTDKIYFSGRTKDQLNAMIREGERCGLMPLYAHRRKGVRGDSWRMFRVETKGLTDPLKALESSIPALPLNRNGSPFIDWEQGMPLNKFMALMCTNPIQDATLGALQERTERLPVPKKTAQRRKKEVVDVLAELERKRSVNTPWLTDTEPPW